MHEQNSNASAGQSNASQGQVEECYRCGGQGGEPGESFGDYGWHPCYRCGQTGYLPAGTEDRERAWHEYEARDTFAYRKEWREGDDLDSRPFIEDGEEHGYLILEDGSTTPLITLPLTPPVQGVTGPDEDIPF